ncbi:MAG: hypothetical protein Q8J78_05015 [Moraxellaceae bacterium]|nr:hypothetical protein [Moraxellaceae bacterium]
MMTEVYYRVVVDPKAIDRWYLGAPFDSEGGEVDPRDFTQGKVTGWNASLVVRLRKTGRQIDFNFADFDMVVVDRRLSPILREFSGTSLQLLHSTVDGTKNAYDIVNVCDLVDCIDESSSQYLKWSSADGRPEKIGQYRMITSLRIDPSRASGHHLFRLVGWPVALIVSGELKAALEASGVSGVSFSRVS